MNEKAMTFPRRDRGVERRVGVEVARDADNKGWVSMSIRVFTGPRKALSV